ncbi:MAG: hypothetical protein M1835_006476 [Candelina submexicana]|nr:MAG: hypothetical protein M1835_006476 [Candelina submexicana]
MEAASLTRAHTHARNAVRDFHKSNSVAASEEHELAAGEFSSAAKATEDTEALRILNLLEQHHMKLSQALRSDPAIPGPAPPAASNSLQQPRPSSPRRQSQPAPSLSSPHRPPPPSSIASDLASARGIPSLSQQRRGVTAPTSLSAQHAGGKILSPPARTTKHREERPRLDSPSRRGEARQSSPAAGRPSKNTQTKDQKQAKTASGKEQPTPTNDEPFQRFYATFEGLLSRLSAPLAFAGLPLRPEEPAAAVSPTKSEHQQEKATTAETEPDVTRLFSKAALRAMRDEHGPGSGGLGGAESFYVVPTTGGTISYAGILSRAEQEARLQGLIPDNNEHGEDEFVDARETPQPISPGLKKRPPKGTKTMEELQLENSALKHLSDTLSRRLQMWEVNAQSSSLALQQSLRTLPTTGSPTPSEAGGAARADETVRELEEQLRVMRRDMEKMGRENEKLRGVVVRYRERWEKLKEGARVRREGTERGDEATV